MCSLAHRYSKVFRELGVLMSGLYANLPRFNRSHHMAYLPERTKLHHYAIESTSNPFTARQRGHQLSRSIDSFRIIPLFYLIDFDGLPNGIGFRVFRFNLN